jgi:hypothetical protein
MEIDMEFPQKLKNRVTCDPAIPLLDIYTKESKISFL